MNKVINDPKVPVFFTGTGLMLAQTPIVTSLNRVSVICCYSNVSMLESISQIYSGKADGIPKNSSLHFLKGISGHLTKETVRVGYKVNGIIIKPQIDQYFQSQPLATMKADLTFAGSLALAEMAINPADTLRTMWQAGEKMSSIPKGNLLSHLYKGSTANGLRQFGTWLGFPVSERVWSNVLENYSSLDPHLMSGIIIKSFPQSFQITGPVWIFERLKNELQYHVKLDHPYKRFHYTQVLKHILDQQGCVGLTRGFMPKVLSNWVLIIGANYLLEQGRAIQKRQ